MRHGMRAVNEIMTFAMQAGRPAGACHVHRGACSFVEVIDWIVVERDT